MNSDATELRREQQRERRAARARPGPCLLCGTFTDDPQPGRDAGFHVYCAICAIGTRTAATLEER
jgi:hypothetical protein